jgi:hypothetical protein
VAGGGPLGGIYEVGVTDGAGVATLALPVDAAGSATMVVTAPNRIPYASTIAITEGTGIEDGGTARVTALLQNSPNPFSSSTEIAFTLARPGRVSVAVYDAGGRRVASLKDGDAEAGSFRLVWDGRDESGRPVNRGVYWVRTQVAGSG